MDGYNPVMMRVKDKASVHSDWDKTYLWHARDVRCFEVGCLTGTSPMRQYEDGSLHRRHCVIGLLRGSLFWYPMDS
jgi:hypothetical protein